MSLANRRMQFLRSQEASGVLGVIAENISAERDLAARFADELAHFEGHNRCEFISLCAEDFRRPGYDDSALDIGPLFPALEADRRCGELLLKLPVG